MSNGFRCEWIDFAKGFAIFLVVLGHSVQYFLCRDDYVNHPLWIFIYSFHMPFFMLLSGYVVGLKGRIKLDIGRKVKRLLVPYFAWAIVNWIAMTIIKGYDPYRVLNYIYTPSMGGLWYLWALFFIYILHSGICIVFQNITYRAASFFIITAILFLLSNFFEGHYGLSEIAKYFPYYVIGFYMGTKKFLEKGISITCGVLVIGGGIILTICVLADILHGAVINFMLAMTLSVCCMIMARYIKIKPFQIILKSLSKYTLGVYAIDTYIIVTLGRLIDNLWFWPVAVIIDLSFSFMLSLLLSKNKYLSRIFLGTK